MTYPSRHIAVSINKPVHEVYAFVSNPQNLPKWAEGLSRSKLEKSDLDWIADSPMGKIKVRFTASNEYGVVDHDVTLPSGEVNHNPLRVLRNGDGSEVVFTLYRLPRMTDSAFEADAAQIEKDLRTLKSLLET